MARLLSFAVFVSAIACGLADKNEARLLKDLFKEYDARTRPVLTHGDAVQVKIGIGLTDIFEAQGNNVFSIHGWINQQWNDAYLRWDSAQYGGIESIKLQPNVFGQQPTLWTPDITIYRGQMFSLDTTTTVRAQVSSDGHVVWVPGRNFRVRCDPQVDAGQPKNLTCQLMFGSWVYPKKEVDLQHLGNETVTNFLLTSKSVDKWSVTDVEYKRKEVTFPCCPDPYVYFTFTLTLTENKSLG